MGRRVAWGRKRLSYPPFHRQSIGLQTGSENKSCCTWGEEPQRAGESRSSPSQGPNPTFPSSLHTHSPTPSYNGEPKSPEEEGENRASSKLEFSFPQRGDRAPEVGDRAGGWEGKSKGLGITHRGLARAAAPSLAPRAAGGGGKGRGPPG